MLADANKKLHIENNKDIIFVYCPPKVGSTSLVSSIRLFASNTYSVIHLHNESMLNMFNINNITILDIIKYNKSLGKTVYVFDIYRSPIEQKISFFFEEIKQHFNNTEQNINKIDLSIIIKRFNNIFPYIETLDYYKNVYNIDYDGQFDFEKKYVLKEVDGIKYIKIRLKDCETNWTQILQDILRINIKIVKDYATENKIIKDSFIKFKQEYKIPSNLLDTIKELKFYYTEEERNEYISSWQSKVTDDFLSYNESEYKLYKSICSENIIEIVLQKNHYMDLGCTCQLCSIKRQSITTQIMKGEQVTDKIIHKLNNPIPILIKKLRPHPAAFLKKLIK